MSVTFHIASDTEGELAVNMSNSNTYRVMRALGLTPEPDWYGRLDPADLLGRILLAEGNGRADVLDVGSPGSRAIVAALAAGGARVIDCAPPLDEYLAMRLPHLRALAEAALAAGEEISWG